MIFNSGWTRQEIEQLTYIELCEYVRLFYKIEAENLFDMFKAFCFYNCESSAMAFASKPSDMKKYLNDVLKRTMEAEETNNLEDQFKGLNIG